MDIMFLLLGASLVVALLFLVVFIISVRSGQFDDLHTPSVRILFDDAFEKPEEETLENNNNLNITKSKTIEHKTTD